MPIVQLVWRLLEFAFFVRLTSVAALFILGDMTMGTVKVKIPRFCTGEQHNLPCPVTVFVDNRPCLYCYSGSVALFEVKRPCIASFLINRANIGDGLSYYQDLVISGMVSPDKQYEIVPTKTSYEIIQSPKQ